MPLLPDPRVEPVRVEAPCESQIQFDDWHPRVVASPHQEASKQEGVEEDAQQKVGGTEKMVATQVLVEPPARHDEGGQLLEQAHREHDARSDAQHPVAQEHVCRVVYHGRDHMQLSPAAPHRARQCRPPHAKAQERARVCRQTGLHYATAGTPVKHEAPDKVEHRLGPEEMDQKARQICLHQHLRSHPHVPMQGRRIEALRDTARRRTRVHARQS